MASEKIFNLTDANFADVIGSDKPVLVDFWAAWCGPCRRVAPILEELADERDDIAIAKVNVDEHPAIAAKYQVQSLPSFLLFSGGEVKDRMMGAMPKSSYQDFIEKNVEVAAPADA